MPWVAGGVVPTTGKNRATAEAQREDEDMRRWSVAERVQGWEVGDKSCVTTDGPTLPPVKTNALTPLGFRR